MTSKKTRPTLTKAAKPRPINSRQKGLSKQKWLIAACLLLLLIVIAYFVWPRPLSSSSAPVEITPAPTGQTEAASVTAEDVDANDTFMSETDGTQTSDPDSIINAPLPETDSLAKEEVDRLNDEHQQMVEQEKRAAEQVVMNKQLTEMKAEQIDLLEQQIAQLEASQKAETAAK